MNSLVTITYNNNVNSYMMCKFFTMHIHLKCLLLTDEYFLLNKNEYKLYNICVYFNIEPEHIYTKKNLYDLPKV